MSSASRNLLLGLALAMGSGCGRLTAPDGRTDDSSGEGPTPPPEFVAGGGAPHERVALVSAVPEATRVRIDWALENVSAEELLLEVLLGTDPEVLTPVDGAVVDPAAGSLVLEGLDEGVEYFVTLRRSPVAPLGVEEAAPTGPVLRFRTGTPLYVDPAADPVGADGTTPETAFPNLFDGVLFSFVFGGGNVWVAGGDQLGVSVPMLPGVDLYGGFAPGFVLEERDPSVHSSRLLGAAGDSVLTLEPADLPTTVDGFAIDGLGIASNGIDVKERTLHLRRTTVVGCNRGLRLRTDPTADVMVIRIADSSFSANTVGGISADGVLDLELFDCDLIDNGGEGIDVGPLLAPEGEEVALRLVGCTLARNGADGLDVDLAAGSGTLGGDFEIVVRRCDVVGNALDGLLIDLDYEASPAWYADVLVEGVKTLANGRHGLNLDLDAPATVVVQRALSGANRGHGVRISSESRPGLATVAASALVGNHGLGLSAEFGNYTVLLSHGVLAGNRAGGFASEVVASHAVSSVAYLQAAPFSGVEVDSCLVVDEADPPVFGYAAEAFALVTGQSSGLLELDPVPGLAVGQLCEIDGDGTARAVSAVDAAGRVVLEPAPQLPDLPATLAAYPGDSVLANYAPAEGSPLQGAGMAGPGQPAVDLGPAGSPTGGDPGTVPGPGGGLFVVEGIEPSLLGGLAAGQELRLRFDGGAPDPASAAAAVSAVDPDGLDVPLLPLVQGSELVVPAPAGGWRPGTFLRLHSPLRSLEGVPLSVPLSLSLGSQP